MNARPRDRCARCGGGCRCGIADAQPRVCSTLLNVATLLAK
jgi:hypothetical protein